MIAAPIGHIVRGHRYLRRGNILIADFGNAGSADRQSHADTRTEPTTAPRESETAETQAEGGGRIVEDMRSADEYDARGGVARSIVGNQRRIGWWLEAAHHHLH